MLQMLSTGTEACDASFKQLKEVLCSPPVLRSPDFTKLFILQTDASDIAVGAVLSQQDEKGADHPVGYFSRKLLPREVRYSTIEKECLAIKLATQSFRVYLLGRDFVIQTDHRSLEWLDKLKESNARLTRWSLALQPFTAHSPWNTERELRMAMQRVFLTLDQLNGVFEVIIELAKKTG